MNQKILLLRVGIDTQYGMLGPIFEDSTFEYIPIPEHPLFVSIRSIKYKDIPARYGGGTLDKYLPDKLKNSYVHHDPEFKTFTYGDPTKNKSKQLMKLNPGDYIIFYAGLRYKGESKHKLYIIGHFYIKKIYSFGYAPKPMDIPEFENNAHLMRRGYSKKLVIAKGTKNGSRLLTKAIQISDEKQNLLLDTPFGLEGSIKRSGAGRWVRENNVEQTISFIHYNI